VKEDRPPSSDVIAGYIRGHLFQLQRLEALFRETNNPLYVWNAIWHCFAMGELRQMLEGDAEGDPQPVSPYPFPNWCLSYLSAAANQFTDLCRGADRANEAPVTPAEALKAVPSVLGFGRKGFNAFDSWNATLDAEINAHAFDVLKEERGYEATMDAFRDFLGVENDRAVNKHLEKARRAISRLRPRRKGSKETH